MFPSFNLIGGKFEFRNEKQLLAELFREVHVSVKIPFDGFSIFWLPWLGETNLSLLDFGMRSGRQSNFNNCLNYSTVERNSLAALNVF